MSCRTPDDSERDPDDEPDSIMNISELSGNHRVFGLSRCVCDVTNSTASCACGLRVGELHLIMLTKM
jgi:hypothetical protein